LALGHVREYFRATRTLAPFFPTPTSFDTTSTFIALHPKADGYSTFFFEYYKLNKNLEFFSDFFKLVFQHISHLSASGHFGIIFEHF
jgi:hypothetical protein